MKKYNKYLLNAISIKILLLFLTMSVISSVGLKSDFLSSSLTNFNIISSANAEPELLVLPDGDIEYTEETARLSEEEKADRAKYEEIEATVKEEIGSTAVTSSALADTISTVAALFGVDVEVDYDKKGGLSCFSLDSAGTLNVVSCSTSGEVLSSCDATAAEDWKSATISCSGFDMTATVVE